MNINYIIQPYSIRSFLYWNKFIKHTEFRGTLRIKTVYYTKEYNGYSTRISYGVDYLMISVNKEFVLKAIPNQIGDGTKPSHEDIYKELLWWFVNNTDVVGKVEYPCFDASLRKEFKETNLMTLNPKKGMRILKRKYANDDNPASALMKAFFGGYTNPLETALNFPSLFFGFGSEGKGFKVLKDITYETEDGIRTLKAGDKMAIGGQAMKEKYPDSVEIIDYNKQKEEVIKFIRSLDK